MSQDLDSIFPRHSRIVHLEDNRYLYGDVPPGLLQNSPRQLADEVYLRKVQDREEQLLRSSLAYSRSANSLDIESQRDYDAEELLRRRDDLMRQQDLRNSLHLSTRDLVNRSTEYDQRSSVPRANPKALLLKVNPVKSTDITPKAHKTRKRPGSQHGKSRKSAIQENKNSRFSKYNTKSPYNKPTFSYLVKTIDNQKYTYDTTKKSRRSSVKRDFFADLIELAETHAELCPSFREKFLKLRHRHS